MIVGHHCLSEFLDGVFGVKKAESTLMNPMLDHTVFLSTPVANICNGARDGTGVQELFILVAAVDNYLDTHYVKIHGGNVFYVHTPMGNLSVQTKIENYLEELYCKVQIFFQEFRKLDVRPGLVAFPKDYILLLADNVKIEVEVGMHPSVV